MKTIEIVLLFVVAICSYGAGIKDQPGKSSAKTPSFASILQREFQTELAGAKSVYLVAPADKIQGATNVVKNIKSDYAIVTKVSDLRNFDISRHKGFIFQDFQVSWLMNSEKASWETIAYIISGVRSTQVDDINLRGTENLPRVIISTKTFDQTCFQIVQELKLWNVRTTTTDRTNLREGLGHVKRNIFQRTLTAAHSESILDADYFKAWWYANTNERFIEWETSD